MTITHLQIRAARALIEWRGEDLAHEAGCSLMTIRRAEQGKPISQLAMAAIEKAFENNRVKFVTNGVFMKPLPRRKGFD